MDINYCNCGCNQKLKEGLYKGKVRVFIHGHNRKGEHLLDEHKRKIGEAQLGEKNHNYGKHHSKETKKKMSDTQKKIINKGHFKKGQTPPRWVIEKLIKVNTGKKTGIFKECIICNNKYYVYPYEKDMRVVCSKECGYKIKRTAWNKGKINCFSEDVIKKMKEKRAKQIIPVKDSKIEVKIQEYLKLLGIDFFTHQYIKDINHGYQCDILVPSMNLIIECDGDYWHKFPIGRGIDHIRTKELIEKGFKVLRLWEKEIKAMSLSEFKEKLK